MKNVIILSCFLLVILNAQGPAPPVWPETFSQDFVQGDSKSKIYESGKLWYDIKNSRQRMDYSGSAFQSVCFNLAPDIRTRCSSIFVNNSLYISFPEASKCCKCCTTATANKCPILPLLPRDWLRNYQYSGEATLSGATFYRWTFSGLNYYATEDQARIPRRFDEGTFALDFIMNTYSTDSIDDSVFTVSSTCNTPCPKNSGCVPSLE